MLILDVLLRYSSVTLLFLIAALAVRDGREFRPAIYIVLASLTIAFMLLGTAPTELRLPNPFYALVRLLDFGNIVFIWWLGLAIFQDDFRLRWPHWFIFAINFAALMPGRIMEFQGNTYFHPIANYGLDLVTLGIMGHLVFVALKGRSDDLIERRRRFRLYFILAMVLSTLAAIFAENLLAANHQVFLQTFRCVIIFPLALWAVLWLTEMHPEKVIFNEPINLEEDTPDIDPRDQLLLSQLKTVMEDDKIYTEPGLTIRLLAQHLKSPEHRLRSLINSGLGYRNFSAFLNDYRIRAIKTAFADPKNSRIPVLTIALDHGYNSLAPFNRAFKESESMTPSAYRQSLQK